MSFALAKHSRRLSLVDDILKYKQSWMYMSEPKLRLLVLKEEHDSPITSHRGEKTTIVAVSIRYYWLCMKKEIATF